MLVKHGILWNFVSILGNFFGFTAFCVSATTTAHEPLRLIPDRQPGNQTFLILSQNIELP